MTKQELARGRNWSKRQVAGVLSNITGLQYRNKDFLTPEERDLLNKAQLQIDLLLIKWDKNSEQLGLKLRNKPDICTK